MREQDYCSESHYRIVSPTFQYKMSHQRVGKCIIINNKNFDEKTGREKTSNLNLVTHRRAVSFHLAPGLPVFNRDECTQRYGSRRRRASQVLQDPWLWCLRLQRSDMWEDGTSPQRGWDRQVSMYLIGHTFLLEFSQGRTEIEPRPVHLTASISPSRSSVIQWFLHWTCLHSGEL